MVLQIVIVPRDWLPHEYRLDTVDLGHALDLALVLQISMDDRFKLVAWNSNRPVDRKVDLRIGGESVGDRRGYLNDGKPPDPLLKPSAPALEARCVENPRVAVPPERAPIEDELVEAIDE